MATIFRAPLILKFEKRTLPAAVESETQVYTNNRLLNLLLSQDQFFGAPGQVPALLNWPVPRGYPRVVQDHISGSFLALTTVTAVPVFPSMLSTAVPVSRRSGISMDALPRSIALTSAGVKGFIAEQWNLNPLSLGGLSS